MDGSATLTMVWSRTIISNPEQSTRSASQRGAVVDATSPLSERIDGPSQPLPARTPARSWLTSLCFFENSADAVSTVGRVGGSSLQSNDSVEISWIALPGFLWLRDVWAPTTLECRALTGFSIRNMTYIRRASAR